MHKLFFTNFALLLIQEASLSAKITEKKWSSMLFTKKEVMETYRTSTSSKISYLKLE